MAIFATQFTKLGNIWPLDYLAIMPTGETKRFRLKRRQSKKSVVGDEQQFVNVDDSDTNIYRTRLEIEPIKENFDGKIYGIPLLLDASICKLCDTTLTWKERKEIIRKLKE